MTYKKELEVALKLAKKAAKAIIPFYYEGMSVEGKEDGTPITNADILANEIIQEGIQKAYPDDGIISEELESVEGERIWYIDPIDGTKGFVRHTDHFAIHIGLANSKGKPVVGVVYKPTTNEYYFASEQSGAWRVSPGGMKKQLHLDYNVDYDKLCLATNSKLLRQDLGKKVQEVMNLKSICVGGGQGLRMMYLLDGEADMQFGNYPNWCKAWDVCAPQAIIEEAGGLVTNIKGEKIRYTNQQELGDFFVVAKTKQLANYVCDKVKGILEE
jgi:3'(2'), 5'-bisphosphate nucleotidase